MLNGNYSYKVTACHNKKEKNTDGGKKEKKEYVNENFWV